MKYYISSELGESVLYSPSLNWEERFVTLSRKGVAPNKKYIFEISLLGISSEDREPIENEYERLVHHDKVIILDKNETVIYNGIKPKRKARKRMKKKTRGFEKISQEQFAQDFNESEVDYKTDVLSPKKGTFGSACYDLILPIDINLEPMQEVKVPTGIKAYMLQDEVLLAYPRSGQGFKYHIKLANTVGIIDSDYYNNKGNEGHIWVKLRNEGNETFECKKGTAFVQVMFQKYLLADDDNFNSGEIRIGGFGSTSQQAKK